MTSKSGGGINYERLIEHALQARPAASIEELRRIAPQLNALHFNDLAARVARQRIRNEATRAASSRKAVMQ